MLSLSVLLLGPAGLAAHQVRAWAENSQQRARRNAMVAATACAQRRAEREEIDDFLTHRRGRGATGDGVTAL